MTKLEYLPDENMATQKYKIVNYISVRKYEMVFLLIYLYNNHIKIMNDTV